MKSLQLLSAFVVASAALVSSSPTYNARPFDHLLNRRQSSGNSTPAAPVVDLGYERYQGVANSTTGINTFQGIRYAAPPTGSRRWQAPTAPSVNRDQVLLADALPPRCPQSPRSPIPPGFNFTGDEDCLFLSIYAPSGKTNLPVFVWIHGGGYGQGQGDNDVSMMINTNNNSFIGVVIQYRLGAFGFMSSDEIRRYGTVNAGLLDQTFALQWVQSYIHLFGGNSSQVTIGGVSAGGGSVMLQTMAFGGTLGDSLFANAIPASPYLPQQFGYADFVPSQSYYAFAAAVGCFNGFPQGNISNSIFQCLVGKDTDTLQNASASVSGSSRFGTWGFLPVTDGSFVQQLPSQQLLEKRVNGRRILSGNNANEGPLFTPFNILTEDDFVSFLRNEFPLFTKDDISRILLYYPSTNASVVLDEPEFATSGTMGATALNQSTFATGQQQRALDVYAETTFVCPSYWLAEAFTNNGREGWKYQFSAGAAQHGADQSAYLGPLVPFQGPDLRTAFQTIYGNFITKNDPSISAEIAAGASSNSSSPMSPADPWPAYNLAAPYQLDLNQTGGVPFQIPPYPGENLANVTEFAEPGLRNNFSLVNAYTWEGGRGMRCDFWRSVGRIVPE